MICAADLSRNTIRFVKKIAPVIGSNFSLSKKTFAKLVDGGASSPATTTPASLR